MPKKKQGDTQPLSLRLDADMIWRIDRMTERHHGTVYPPGFHSGKAGPPKMSRADMIRWLLSEGMEVVEQKLKELTVRRRQELSSRGGR